MDALEHVVEVVISDHQIFAVGADIRIIHSNFEVGNLVSLNNRSQTSTCHDSIQFRLDSRSGGIRLLSHSRIAIANYRETVWIYRRAPEQDERAGGICPESARTFQRNLIENTILDV